MSKNKDEIAVSKDDKGDIINNKNWLNGNFSDQKRFEKHIIKHLSEYDNITLNEYLNIARKFYQLI